MTKFTKEQRDILIKTAEYMVKRENTSEYSENIRKVAEIALAALTAGMEQEPIILYRERNPVTGMTTGWVELTQEEYGFIKDHSSEDADFKRVYAAPQLPQPAVVDADDNFYSWFGREWHENYQHNQYTTAAKQMLGVMAESAWRAGRSAAMLQGAHRDLSYPVDPQVAEYEEIIQPAVPGEAEMPSGPGVPEYNVGWANGWNSCREEMLQGAEPVSQPSTLPAELRDAISRLLDSDGSRGTFSAIQCSDARRELERLLVAAPQQEV